MLSSPSFGSNFLLFKVESYELVEMRRRISSCSLIIFEIEFLQFAFWKHPSGVSNALPSLANRSQPFGLVNCGQAYIIQNTANLPRDRKNRQNRGFHFLVQQFQGFSEKDYNAHRAIDNLCFSFFPNPFFSTCELNVIHCLQ